MIKSLTYRFTGHKQLFLRNNKSDLQLKCGKSLAMYIDHPERNAFFSKKWNYSLTVNDFLF